MKEKRQQPADRSRREFLGTGAAVGVGVVVAASLPKQAVAQTEEPSQAESRGYRLTDHILAYYRSAAD